MNTNYRLHGVYPILPTPFLEDDTIDTKSLVRIVRFLLDAGVNGISLFGNASEAFALTSKEKDLIAEIVSAEVDGHVPLVFGAGGTAIEPAVESSKWAASKGASALMIMPPYMIKPDGQRIYEYYATIAKATDVPIMIQDAPGACGVNIPLDVIIKLFKDCDTIQYIKAEAPPTFLQIQKLLDASSGDMTIFGGLNGTFFYEELCMGASGTMPAGEFPEVLVNVYNTYQSGNKKKAKEIFYTYLPFIRLGSIPGGMAMAVHKEILKRGGIFTTSKVRNPYIPASKELIQLALDAIDGLDLLALTGKATK